MFVYRKEGFVKVGLKEYMLTLGGFLLCGWGDGGRDWAEWTSISQSEMGEPQRTIFLHFLGGKSKSGNKAVPSKTELPLASW